MSVSAEAPRRGLPVAQGLAAGAVILLPTVLAFFSGGFFDKPRLIAGLVVWAVVAFAAISGAPVFPRGRAGRAALGGLALLTAWTVLSLAWAPLAGRALDDSQRAVLYLGVAVAAAALLRPRPVARLVEPLLVVGALTSIGYALAGRLLPGLVEQEVSRGALGRLDQPLTYWNATGALAALGIVLCARLAGDAERPAWMRAAAAAAAAPLGAGLYLTFSRGGLATAVAGLVVLAALVPRREQLLGGGLVAAAAAAGALSVAFFPAIKDPGADGAELQGALALAALVVVSAAAALVGRSSGRSSGEAGRGRNGIGRPAAVAVAAAVVAALVVVGATGLGTEQVAREKTKGADPSRLGSVESERYEYWRVAGSAFADHPLRGTGAGGFAVEWRRERPAGSAPAADAHSLYLESAAELGAVGLACLALFLGGLVLCARDAMRSDPVLSAGPLAVLTAWGVHAGLDWDWEMPAVTLVALVAAGLLVAAADRVPRRS